MNGVFECLFSILCLEPFRICNFPLLLTFLTRRTAIIAGPITTNLGWKWLFHILVIFTAVQIILMFFFCPETTYEREAAYNIDQIQHQDFEKLAVKQQEASKKIDGAESSIPKTKSFLESLKPWSGIHSDDNFIKLVIAPFASLFNIGALYTIIASGILTSWIVAISFILAQVFSPPPYGFTAAQVGYLSTGPFVGGLLGCIFMAIITDPMIRYFSKKNHGL